MLARSEAPGLVSKTLGVALLAMFLQQSFAELSKVIVPLVAPAALPELGVPAAYVGVFVSFVGICKMFVHLGCGNVIRRYGGIRVSQVGLVLVLLAMVFGASGYVWAFLFTAVLLALGVASSTPASSHILARYSPPKYAPLVFSAKQTAVPFGLSVAGILIPFLVALFGWQGAMLAIGMLCAGFALLLQPVRAELDSDRNPSQKLSMKDLSTTLMLVLRTPGLRSLAIAKFAFVGLQTTYTTYLVLFLTQKLGFGLAEAAGGILATAMAISIPTRIFWGYIASRWLSPATVLAALSVSMAGASVLTGLMSPDWAYWQILAVAILFTSTGLGWQGVMLSEVARLAPAGQVGAATGGVASFSSFGQVVLPLAFSAVLAFTGSYALGFYLAGLPALVGGIALFALSLREIPAGPNTTAGFRSSREKSVG